MTYGYLEVAGATLEQYAKWTRASVLRVAQVTANAEEKEAITKAPGLYGTDCGQHIVMLNSPWLGVAASGKATVQNADGTPFTLHDALAAWATGTTIRALDTHPTSPSLAVCSHTTKER